MDDFDPERLAVLTRRLRQERDEGQRIIQFLSVERQAMEEGNRKVVAKIKSEHQQSKDQAKEVLQSLVLAISVLYKSTRSVKTRSTLKSSLLISQKVQEPIKLEFEVSSSLSVDGANTSSIEDSQKECMSDVEMRNMPSDEEEMSSIFLVNEESLVKKTAEDLNQTPAVIHSLTHCSPSKFEQVEFPFAEISAFMDDTLESRLENCIKNSALDDQQQIDTKSTVAEIETLREQVSSLKAQLDLKECEVEFSDTKLKNLNQQLSELDSMAKNLAHEQIPGLRNEVKGLRVELEQEKDLSKHLEDQLKAVVSQKEIHLETISRLQADLDSKELYLSDRVEELEKTIEGHLSTIVKMNETQIAVESKKDLSERKCFELLKRVFEVDLRKDEGDSIAEQSGQWGIEASKCQNHTSEFEGKVVIAIKRLAELEAQLEGFEKLLKDSSEKAMRFSDEKQTVVNQLQDSEKVNEQLREEVDRLTTCCKQNTVDTVDSEEAERQRQDLEKRLGEVVRLSAERQSDLDRLTLEAERQRQDLEKRLEEVCEEVVRLSAERQFDLERLTLEAQTQRQVMEKRAEELSEEVLRLSAEKQAVLDQFQGSEKVVEQLNEEVSRLSAEKQATVDSFQSEIKSQQTSKERISAEIEEARSNSRIALASLASIESELVASKEEINQLKVELKSSNLQLESIQDKSKAYDTLVEEIKLERLSNVKVLKELEEARSSYKDAIAHNEVTIARLIDAEEESKKLRAALESVKSKVSSMEDMSKAYEALVISFESVQAEAESLKNQVEMLCEGSRTDSVRIEKLVAEIEEREELVNSLKADLMTFSKLQRNTSSPTMNNRISELETIVGLKTSEADEAMDRLLEEMRKNKKLTNLVENLRMRLVCLFFYFYFLLFHYLWR
ncbi:hypothetical protein BY996DRAFT_3030670 [Phakopsora pachyrhizi]|nr:hypothetical protein BY996DRAFT_3030670 [Phakopsora pachyrhizi]